MQIPDKKTRVRRSWVWIRDPEKKNFSRNLCQSKNLEQNLIGWKIKRPFRKSSWMKKLSGPVFAASKVEAGPMKSSASSGPGSFRRLFSFHPRLRWTRKVRSSFCWFSKKPEPAWKMDLRCFRENPILMGWGPLERIKTNKSKKGRRFKI